MAEGLTPSEAAKELEHHRHSEQGRHGETRREVIAILEAVLLSVVTIVTAWAGYSAAKWGTESRLELAHASALRIEANRAFAIAAENRNFDASTFDAWQATDPDHNPSAPPGPTYMPEYRQPQKDQANQLDRRADVETASGYHSASVADNYVRITVLLATVLFLVGIGSTFRVRQVRLVLASVGAVMLVTAVALIAQQPLPR